jgi:hypothetical protein
MPESIVVVGGGATSPTLATPSRSAAAAAGPVALFPDQGMTWHHYRGTADTSGDHEIVDPSYEPKVEWHLPDEIPTDG